MKKKNCRFTGMKTRIHILLFLITGVMLAVACSKGGNSAGDNGDGYHGAPAPNDTIAPVLTIYTPISNQVFTSGNTISITGRITDDLGLYQGSIRITNDATGALL